LCGVKKRAEKILRASSGKKRGPSNSDSKKHIDDISELPVMTYLPQYVRVTILDELDKK